MGRAEEQQPGDRTADQLSSGCAAAAQVSILLLPSVVRYLRWKPDHPTWIATQFNPAAFGSVPQYPNTAIQVRRQDTGGTSPEHQKRHWGLSGRRFKSCQPDQRSSGWEAVSEQSGTAFSRHPRVSDTTPSRARHLLPSLIGHAPDPADASTRGGTLRQAWDRCCRGATPLPASRRPGY